MNKYINQIDNEKVYKTLWGLNVGKYDLTRNNISRGTMTTILGEEEYIRVTLDILKHSQPTNKQVDLYIFNYDIYQVAQESNKLSNKELMQVIKALYKDFDKYGENWISYHTTKENKIFEIQQEKDYLASFVAVEKAHKQKLEKINQGIESKYNEMQ